jgi:hypothetical protein
MNMMNQKILLTFSKIFGVLFVIFGVLVGVSALLTLLASGVAGYAETLAAQVGKSVGDFPYAYALTGAILILLLAGLYFVSAFGLFKQTRWASYAVAGIGVVGLASNALLFAAGGEPNPIELAWSIFYLYFAYQIFQHKKVFKH